MWTIATFCRPRFVTGAPRPGQTNARGLDEESEEEQRSDRETGCPFGIRLWLRAEVRERLKLGFRFGSTAEEFTGAFVASGSSVREA